MYEENRRFSWTNFFIKGIIVIIFILFTVWLLSLSTKDLSNSLNVLTDDIFSQNIEKMKEVGKSYFTTERLPQKVGDIETLTLAKMYDERLILELKDKNGDACSARNSYVSVEKLENEYRMKVYLECGDEEDYIIVIMGCYDYCDSAICEKEEVTSTSTKDIEYQYSKTTGGKWTDYGNWSEWSKVSVTENSYRKVETKTVKEEYSYDKTVTELVYTQEATCPEMEGYTLANKDGEKCTYTKNITATADPTCPEMEGYTLTSRDGFNCSYTKKSTESVDPTCPSMSGYTLKSRDGFTCTYTKTTSSTANPVCPSVSGYTYSSRSGFTCNYYKTVTSSYWGYYGYGSDYYVPANTSNWKYVQTSADYIWSCTSSCAYRWLYTYDVYKKYTSSSKTWTTKTASCPSGYNNVDGTCTAYSTTTKTDTATCPDGYTQSGNTCVKDVTENKTGSATCPTGFEQSGKACVKYSTSNKIDTATCPVNQKLKDGKCYKEETSTVKVTGYKDVKYYRYKTREYIGGTTDYKWSKSNNDQSLIKAGYKLTGKTR